MRTAKGEGQWTLKTEYPPPECILPRQCTAKTSVWKTERAYQRGENAAVRSWSRKVYGVWPRNNQQGHRGSVPFYPCPNLLKVGLAFMQTTEIVKPANYFSKWEIGLPLWLLHCYTIQRLKKFTKNAPRKHLGTVHIRQVWYNCRCAYYSANDPEKHYRCQFRWSIKKEDTVEIIDS